MGLMYLMIRTFEGVMERGIFVRRDERSCRISIHSQYTLIGKRAEIPEPPDVSCQCQLSYTRACKATFRVPVVYGVVIVQYQEHSELLVLLPQSCQPSMPPDYRNDVTVSEEMMRYDSNTASSSKG